MSGFVYENSGTISEAYAAATFNGIAGGNGTSNPIFAYGIAQTGSGYIETAQLK